MYNPITAIRELYHKLTRREEVRENEEGRLARVLKERAKGIVDERQSLQAYTSWYRGHFANNPGFR